MLQSQEESKKETKHKNLFLKLVCKKTISLFNIKCHDSHHQHRYLNLHCNCESKAKLLSLLKASLHLIPQNQERLDIPIQGLVLGTAINAPCHLFPVPGSFAHGRSALSDQVKPCDSLWTLSCRGSYG